MSIQQFDFSVDLLRAILWQYNEAENLQSLLQQKQDWYTENQEQFWSDWQRDVFDLTTANEFGLSVWAIILELPVVTVQDPVPDDKPNFAFGDDRENFTRGNFGSSSSSVSRFTIEQRRIMLRLRYFQLTTRPSVIEINRMLSIVFKDQGPAFVVDNLNMTMSYVFSFALDPRLSDALTEFDLLPRPAAVGITRTVTPRAGIFGFGENNENFTRGNFLD